MSNTEGSVARAARRHRPAIWGIAIALLVAVIALLVFAPWRGPVDQPTGEITPPATVAPTTDAGQVPATPATGTTAPATNP